MKRTEARPLSQRFVEKRKRKKLLLQGKLGKDDDAVSCWSDQPHMCEPLLDLEIKYDNRIAREGLTTLEHNWLPSN